MAKSDRITELYEWLEKNKIQYAKIDSEVINIPGFGKAYFQDTQRATYNSIFRKDADGNFIFNSLVRPEELLNDGREHCVQVWRQLLLSQFEQRFQAEYTEVYR